MSTLLHSTNSIISMNSHSSSSSLLINFGGNVRTQRLNLGLSQEKLAALAGLHRTYIGMIERAEKNITLTNAHRIASALGCKLVDLIDAA